MKKPKNYLIKRRRGWAPVIASRLLTFSFWTAWHFHFLAAADNDDDTHAHNHPFGITLDSRPSSCFFFIFCAALRFFDLLFQFESHSHTQHPPRNKRLKARERVENKDYVDRSFFAVIILVASQGPRENPENSERKCDWNLPQSDDFRSSEKASECLCGRRRDFERI